MSINGSRALVANQVQINGVLDLNDNALILHATPQTRLSMLNTVEGYIRSAYGATAQHWQGNGITSLQAYSNLNQAVGVILNSRYSTFAGQAVDENTIIAALTLIGDLNLDKTVSIADFIDLSSQFGQSGGWQQGDLD